MSEPTHADLAARIHTIPLPQLCLRSLAQAGVSRDDALAALAAGSLAIGYQVELEQILGWEAVEAYRHRRAIEQFVQAVDRLSEILTGIEAVLRPRPAGKPIKG